jgi:hypothetical protein
MNTSVTKPNFGSVDPSPLSWQHPQQGPSQRARPNMLFPMIHSHYGTLRGFPMKGEATPERILKHISRYLGRRKPADILKQYRATASVAYKFATRLIAVNSDIDCDQDNNRSQRNQYRLYNMLGYSVCRQAIIAQALMQGSVHGNKGGQLFVLEVEMIKAWLPHYSTPDLQVGITEKSTQAYLDAHQHDDVLQGLQCIFDGKHAIGPFHTSHALSYMGNPIYHALFHNDPGLEAHFNLVMVNFTRHLSPFAEQLLIDLQHWSGYSDEEQQRLANAIWAVATLIGNPEYLILALGIESDLQSWFASVELSTCQLHYPIDWNTPADKQPAPHVLELLSAIRKFAASSYLDANQLNAMREQLDAIETSAFHNAFNVHRLTLEYATLMRSELMDVREDDEPSSLAFVSDVLAVRWPREAIVERLQPIDAFIEKGCQCIQAAIDQQIIHNELAQWMNQFCSHLQNRYNSLTALEPDACSAHSALIASVSAPDESIPVLERLKQQHALADAMDVQIDRLIVELERWLECPAPDPDWFTPLDPAASPRTQTFGLADTHPALFHIQELNDTNSDMRTRITQLEEFLVEHQQQLEETRSSLAIKESELTQLKQTVFALQHKPEVDVSVASDDQGVLNLLAQLPDILRQAEPAAVLTLLAEHLHDRLQVLPSALDSANTHHNMINTSEMARRIITLAMQGVDLMRSGARVYDLNNIVPGEVACQESDTVMNTAKLRKLRQFKAQDGTTIEMLTHIPIDGRTRMYFDFDTDNRLRIGYIGKHLPNGSSPTI